MSCKNCRRRCRNEIYKSYFVNEVINVEEPRPGRNLVVERNSKLAFMAILKQFYDQPSVVPLKPRPELGDGSPRNKQLSLIVDFLVVDQSLLVYDCEDLSPSAENSGFLKDWSINETVLDKLGGDSVAVELQIL